MITIAATKAEIRAAGWDWWTMPNTVVGWGTTPVDDIEMSWQSSTPLDHPDPGSLVLTLLVPPNGSDRKLIVYDAQIRVSVSLTDGTTTTALTEVANGWVQSYRRTHRTTDGRDLYQIQLMDVLGRAASVKVGLSPRPDETTAQRLAAINASLNNMLPLTETPTLGRVLPRDVDNYTALDLIRETLPLGFRAIAKPGGIIGPSRPPEWFPIKSTLDGTMRFTGSWPAVTIPAALLADTPRVMSRMGLVTEVSYRVGKGNPYEAAELKKTTKKPGTTFSPSQLSLTTDFQYLDSRIPGIDSWVSTIIETASVPKERLDQTQISFRDASGNVEDLAQLIHVATRNNAVIYIPDAPPDIDQVQILTSATLVIRGRNLWLENVELQPGALYGIHPVRFLDLPTEARLRKQTTRIRYMKLMTLNNPNT